MEPLKVFFSSTHSNRDLLDAAVETIERLSGFEAVYVEDIPASLETEEQAVFAEISRSDIVILLVSEGLRADPSYVQRELKFATSLGKRIIVMMQAESEGAELLTRLLKLYEYQPVNPVLNVFRTLEELRASLTTSLLGTQRSAMSPTFSITFDPELSEEQIEVAFAAIADYYRACGAIGLAVDFEREKVAVGDLAHV